MSDLWDYEDEEAFSERTQPMRRRRRPGGDETRGNLYLLTGLLLGLGLGLLIAWVIAPVAYVDTDPSSLDAAFKDQYRQVIAQAYQATGNLERARERLSLVDGSLTIPALAAQAQRLLAENQPAARALAVLAADLAQPAAATSEAGSGAPPAGETQALIATANETERASLSTLGSGAAIQTATVPLPTMTATITLTPLPSFTPRPTATPLAVLDAPFRMVSTRPVCDGSVPAGLLQVYVSDAQGNPLPGVTITIRWQDGQDTFSTGLEPAVNMGFADFEMRENEAYTIQVGAFSEDLRLINNRPGCAWQAQFTQAAE